MRCEPHLYFMAGTAARGSGRAQRELPRYNGARGTRDPPTPTRYGAAGVEGVRAGPALLQGSSERTRAVSEFQLRNAKFRSSEANRMGKFMHHKRLMMSWALNVQAA